MCVIIHKNLGKEIPFTALQAAASRNAHGWGIMTADRGELVTFRGLELDEPAKAAGKHAEQVARALEQCTDLPTMIHFRYATAGSKDLDNTHPFELLTLNEDGFDLSLMHNGTLQKFKVYNGSQSDTAKFVEEIGKPLFQRAWKYVQDQEGDATNNLLGDPWLRRVLEDYANGTVFTLLSGTGQSLRINPEGGKHYDWGWSSNHTELEPKAPNPKGVSTARSSGFLFDHANDSGTSSFRPKDTAPKHIGAVVPWTPPEDWKVKPELGTKRKTLAQQAEDLRDMIKHSPNNSCVVPQLGARLTADDFLGDTLALDDLAYLSFEDIRDLIQDCPEAAAACFMDLLEKLYVDAKGKVKANTTPYATQIPA